MPSRRNDQEQPADAIALLKADHQRVKDLFAQYEAAANVETKRTLAAQAFIPTAPLRSCRQCLSALRSSGASHTRKEPEGCYQFAAPQMMCTPFHHLK
jgi:hypothetical protein